ncbi:MAG: hypothetical protein IJS94_03180 [Clostridia bacterium]|nr:hypothetical protein [Clostridia bacterium]
MDPDEIPPAEEVEFLPCLVFPDSIKIGDEFTLKVTVPAGYGIPSGTVQVNYDEGKLEIISAVAGEFFSDMTPVINKYYTKDVPEGKKAVRGSFLRNSSENKSGGSIFELTFKALEAGKVNVDTNGTFLYKIFERDEKTQKYNIGDAVKAEIAISADSTLVNYALASNGASYIIKQLNSSGEEAEPSYYENFVDNGYTKLTDGISSPGFNDESGVAFAGTGKQHKIKFDLGRERKINKVILRNVLFDSLYFHTEWQPLDPDFMFAVYIEGNKVDTSFDMKFNASFSDERFYGYTYDFDVYSYDVIVTFGTVYGRYADVSFLSPTYLQSLDEIEIYSESKMQYEYGDINGDGEVDSLDAVAALKYDAGMINLDDAQLLAADVNGDGEVNSLDGSLIFKYDAGLIDEF